MKKTSKFKILLLTLFLIAVIFYLYQKDNFSLKLNQNIQEKLKTQATTQETANQTTQAEHDQYESVYQIPMEVPYCSSDPVGGELGRYPCDATYYRHYKTYTGFKEQWNPNDPKRRCQQDTTCPDDNSDQINYGLNLVSDNYKKSMTGDLFRYYIPKGTNYVELVLYGPPTTGKCATLARFGSPPKSEFPSDFGQFSNPSNYPSIFPPSQYPGVSAFWQGKTISQLKQNDWFALNQGGHIFVVYNNAPALSEGGWLYIKFKRYDNSQIPVHSFSWGAVEATYTNWYNSFTSYDSKGDPAFGQNGNTLQGDIEPQSSPDGDVDIFDYNIFIQYWSQTPVNNPADIDQNGTVNIFDYNLLVGNFGKSGGGNN